MQTRHRLMTACSILALVSGTASAQTTYTVPSAQTPTLEFALNPDVTPVLPGDTIELTEAGFYGTTYTVRIADLTIRAGDGQNIVVNAFGQGSVFTVTSDGTGVVFEGLTITGGVSDADSSSDGGGINATEADITIIDCTIDGNSANDDAGGVYVADGSALIMGCTFVNNSTIEPNVNDNGGALMGFRSLMTVIDCTFDSNTAGNYGGAMYFNSCTIDVRDCTMTNNTARLGGGIGLVTTSEGLVRDTLIQGNDATENGGAIASASAWVDFERCRIIGNEAVEDGGAAWITGETTEETDLRNCLIADNTAGARGGAVIAEVGPDGELQNCTVVGNTAVQGGGMINTGAGAGLRIRNSILRDNTPDQYTTASNTVAFYCNIQGGLNANVGTIDADPMFVDAANGDYRLTAGSPCIDAGDTNEYSADPQPTDLDGNIRAVTDQDTVPVGVPLLNLYVDQGAFEFQPTVVATCPADVNGDGMASPADFTAWLSAFNTGCP